MSEIAPTLALKISKDPDSPRQVIVRVEGDVDECETLLALRGFEIRRKLHLIRGFAVTGSGSLVQQLADEPWVTSIEPDQQVRAL
jgi:hypothetical protein